MIPSQKKRASLHPPTSLLPETRQLLEQIYYDKNKAWIRAHPSSWPLTVERLAGDERWLLVDVLSRARQALGSPRFGHHCIFFPSYPEEVLSVVERSAGAFAGVFIFDVLALRGLWGVSGPARGLLHRAHLLCRSGFPVLFFHEG